MGFRVVAEDDGSDNEALHYPHSNIIVGASQILRKYFVNYLKMVQGEKITVSGLGCRVESRAGSTG